MKANFLVHLSQKMKQYQEMGTATIEQLNDQQIHFKPSPESNSLAILVQHLYGNMMSRWTGFLDQDGEKEWRKRDAEFETMDISKADLLSFWNMGWHQVMTSLQNLTEEDLDKTITIRAESMTAMEGILRHLSHYAYHVGQMVMLAKIILDKDWKTLSIAKGESEAYHESMKQFHNRQ